MFELAVEGWQAEEAILAIFHPVLFHRTTGKFTYQVSTRSQYEQFENNIMGKLISNQCFLQRESSYSVGTVGYEDVDCDCIDHTYVRLGRKETICHNYSIIL